MIISGSCYSFGDGWSIDPRVDPWCPGVEGKAPRILDNRITASGVRLAEFRNDATNDWNLEKL